MKVQLPPLSLYIHLPWCVQKCPYCDFNSHVAGDNAPRDRYVAAILNDLANEAERADNRPIGSIFLGGGTPSLFTPGEIGKILNAAQTRFALNADCEVTLEANPGTVECGDLRGYRHAGVNRLSLGAQSFNADMLRALGRIHGPDEILTAYEEADQAGFNSINIDLMFALPGQDLQLAMEDIVQVCKMRPPHISYYQLTLEPNTIFFARPPAALPDDDLSWEIQEHCHGLLAEAGYERYEISAFARPGHRCRHNLNYWTFGDYIAVGAGAHGKFTDADGLIGRYQKPAHPFTYIEQNADAAPEPQMRTLNKEDICFEYMLNALRLPCGFSEAEFSTRTGLAPAALEGPLTKARADGLMRRSGGGVWQPTALGLRFPNDLQARFLP